MRSTATINRSRSYEAFPFCSPCRVRYRMSRLIRLLRRRCFLSTCQQLSGVMALMLVAAIRLAHFAGGSSAATLVQVLLAAGPSRSPSKRRPRCEIGRHSVSSYQPWNGIDARRPHYSKFAAMLALVSLLPGCATAPLVQGGGLSSYDGLKPSDGKVTKSRLHAKKEQLAAAKTINIAPTAFSPNVAPTLSNEQRVLVANAVNRALCKPQRSLQGCDAGRPSGPHRARRRYPCNRDRRGRSGHLGRDLNRCKFCGYQCSDPDPAHSDRLGRSLHRG